MERINLNNWYINKNEADISLTNLHVRFTVLKNGDFIYYRLIVTDSNMKTLTINFYTLEDAFEFTENVVNNCKTLDEVSMKYQQLFEKSKYIKDDESTICESIILTKNEVNQILIDYFGNEKEYKLSVVPQTYLDDNEEIQIRFYLIEHLYYNNNRNDFKCLLSETDIENALEDYANKNDYEYDNFKYIGGVRRVGYFMDESMPYYEGIKLNVKKRKNIKKLIYEQKNNTTKERK